MEPYLSHINPYIGIPNDIMELACKNEDLELVKILLDRGYPIDDPELLVEVVRSDAVNILDFLLTVKPDITIESYGGWPILARACLWGTSSLVKRLSQHPGVEVDARIEDLNLKARQPCISVMNMKLRRSIS